MIGDYLKNARGDKTLGQIALMAKLDKGYLSKVERGVLIPKLDKLPIIAKAYNVPFVRLLSELLGINIDELETLMRSESEKPKSNCQNPFEKLSEAQRAMFKFHMKQGLECHYQSTDFASNEEFLQKINSTTEQVTKWFDMVNDYSLNTRIRIMLDIIGKTEDNFFDDMNIVITRQEAKALKLMKNEQDTPEQLIISGKEIFSKIAKLSLTSLKLLSSDICEQINVVPQNKKTSIENDIAKDLKEVSHEHISIR